MVGTDRILDPAIVGMVLATQMGEQQAVFLLLVFIVSSCGVCDGVEERIVLASAQVGATGIPSPHPNDILISIYTYRYLYAGRLHHLHPGGSET